MAPRLANCLFPIALALSGAAVAQSGEPASGNDMGEVSQLSAHMGEMAMSAGAMSDEDAPRERIVFEPWQMRDDLLRDDIVLLMRHGPTDWSVRDTVNVAPTDCENQRVMSQEGKREMRNLGILMAANGIVPSQIVVSEWCRNQETLDALLDGYAMIEPGFPDAVTVETDPEANLLLSLQGAPTVTGLRERIGGWEGGEGPLLILSHFTNIAELTEFNVYEGEMLVVDPTRDNRVLGYLRLNTAGPDIGHFPQAAESGIER